MNILKTGAFCVLTLLCFVQSNAQQPTIVTESVYNKPKIFAELPNRLQLNLQILEGLLNDEVGKKINFSLAQGYQFNGVVVSKSDATDTQTKTVVVKATNRQNVTFTLTRTTNLDGSFSYMGRMLSFKHGDAFNITEENGQIVLVKKELHDLVEE